MKRPRIVGRQQHRDNVPSDNIEDHYERNLIIPFVDRAISELRTRFGKDQKNVVSGFLGIIRKLDTVFRNNCIISCRYNIIC